MGDWLNYVGYVAGTFTTASVLPQVIKTWRTKEASDVSISMYIIYLIGAILWVIYGFIKSDWSIIITNGITCLLNIIMLVLKIKYGSETPEKPQAKTA
ncbi:MAG: SemiSWEET family sugar transporter [Saprospiraceae bacterium]